MTEDRILKSEDLDIVGTQFGIKFVGNQIHLYSEDDENWFYTYSFHPFWLSDLIIVCTKALSSKVGQWLIKQ